MQSIWPFLLALARSNGLAFLVAFGVCFLFCAPLILGVRRAERRYLSESGAEIPESSIPQEGEHDAVTRLPTRQSTGVTDL
jgi:hypothetical protein